MRSSEKLRLCLATPLFFPTYGGSQLRFKRYLPGFRQRGLDVRVFTGTPPLNEVTHEGGAETWDQFASGEKLPLEHIGDTPLQRVRLPDAKGWRRTSVFNKLLIEYCTDPETRPDVLQLVGTLRYQSLSMIRKIRKLGIPVLYAVTLAPKEKSGQRRFSLKQLGETRLYNSLDCIVTNNRPLLDFVREAGIRTRVEVIPNGVNLSRFRPVASQDEKMAVRSRFGIGQDDILLTVVGAVTPRKGVDILLEAWSRLVSGNNKIHVMIVGPRKDQEHPSLGEFGQRLEAIVSSSGHPEWVHFAGLHEDVENYLRATDVFVLPSSREGMPNSVLEAMACQLPVVITPFVGLSDDLGQAGTHYLLAERNASSLVSVLSKLVEDEKLRSAVASAGYEWVVENLGVDKSLDRYVALYREMAC